jgi:P27 family predicted phage terminase small subunit
MSLHRLRGTVRPGRHGRRGEPVTPPRGVVRRPASLSKDARAVWDRLAPICRRMGTLTPADAAAFATLCELEATLLRARRAKDAPDFAIVLHGRTHPALKLERDTATALRPFYSAFGLTPSDRARLHVPAAPAADPFETFQQQQRKKWPFVP